MQFSVEHHGVEVIMAIGRGVKFETLQSIFKKSRQWLTWAIEKNGE
jgi:hypothetical protein